MPARCFPATGVPRGALPSSGLGSREPKGPLGWRKHVWYVLAFLGLVNNCGKECAPIPCACPGFDPETCQCRPGGCFPDAGVSDAGAE
jgi:hypothetical protein